MTISNLSAEVVVMIVFGMKTMLMIGVDCANVKVLLDKRCDAISESSDDCDRRRWRVQNCG